jgi:hypothetical protein
MREGFKETAEGTYLCAAEITDWRGLHDAIGRVSAALKSELAALAIARTGPATLFYRFQNDPNRPEGKEGQFVVEAQDPVSFEEEPIRVYGGSLTVRTFPRAECAFLIHQGPIPRDGLPWWRVRQLAEAGGRKRTLQEREIYLHYRGAGDADNVIELQCILEAAERHIVGRIGEQC